MTLPRAVQLEPGWPRPLQVHSYFERLSRELRNLQRRVLIERSVDGESPFFGMTQEKAADEILRLRTELECQATLFLAASFEAVFRRDLTLRARIRPRDRISKTLNRRFGRRHMEEIRFEEILDAWKQEIGEAGPIGKLKQLVALRHWLAHGRYWRQKSGLQRADPYDAWARGGAALSVVPIRAEVDYPPPAAPS